MKTDMIQVYRHLGTGRMLEICTIRQWPNQG